MCPRTATERIVARRGRDGEALWIVGARAVNAIPLATTAEASGWRATTCSMWMRNRRLPVDDWGFVLVGRPCLIALDPEGRRNAAFVVLGATALSGFVRGSRRRSDGPAGRASERRVRLPSIGERTERRPRPRARLPTPRREPERRQLECRRCSHGAELVRTIASWQSAHAGPAADAIEVRLALAITGKLRSEKDRRRGVVPFAVKRDPGSCRRRLMAVPAARAQTA